MRCRHCSYELWNLVPGVCPECGNQWRFEAYRFRPGRVQFLCPKCEQNYAGTDEQGLPTPREFSCTRCSEAVALSSMRAIPAPGSDGSDAMDDDFPWVERRRIGRGRAFRKTLWRAITAPRTLGSTLPTEPALGDALLFAAWTAFLVSLVTIGPLSIFVAVVMSGTRGVSVGFAGLLGAAGVLLAAPLALLLTAVVWALAAHGILRLTGALARPSVSTLSVTLYAMSAFVLSAVPCLGIYLSWIPTIVMANTMVFALSIVQRVSLKRAALAVLAPLLLAAAVAAAIVWATIASVMSATTQVSPPAPLVAPAVGTDSDPEALPGVASESPEEQESADDEFPREGEPDPEEPEPKVDPQVPSSG